MYANDCDTHAWGCDDDGNLQYPEVFAQTWQDADDGNIDISNEDTVILTPNRELGYSGDRPDKGTCIDGNNSGRCIMNSSLRLENRPSLSPPADAVQIGNINDISAPGIYKTGKIENLDLDIVAVQSLSMRVT
ncbi:hypothetical protein JCM19241_4599 [Vibrio ishigakensis]|uniref:Uncharacterized protein n=1 Tax=Vibrio ishigakensis TaxID=1481914 RepID=A0A0B8QFV0_9VIBR|nr:hypothetical protein JCM19241_4599 [Vibrio ishigakensis]